MARSLVAVAAATAASLACAVPASGATPVVVGQATLGGTPDIAVDGAGTGHIVWLDSSPAVEAARYCRLPRGGAACVDPEAFVGEPGDSSGISGRPHVFHSGANTITVFQQRGLTGSGYMMANRSTDGGLTFGSRNRTGEAFPGSAGPDEAAYGPGDTITAITEVTTAGVFVQNGSPLDDSPAAAHAELLSESGEDAAIAMDPADGKPLAVFEEQNVGSDPTLLRWRKLSGAATEAGINSGAAWAPSGLIGGDVQAADGPALAAGPGGVFLFWLATLPDHGYVTKFTGSGWSPSVDITGGDSVGNFDLSQDAGGRLHAVWSAYEDDELRYRWSDDGVNWSATVDIARGEDNYTDVRVAAAADHQGFAVWDRAGADVAAVPLEALPPEIVDPGGPDTTDPSVDGFDVGDPTLLPGQGTSFTFSSSEAGTAILTVRKLVPGLKVRKGGRRRCVPRTRRLVRRLAKSTDSRAELRRLLRKRSCKARKRIGSIRRAVAAGENTIVWNGRIAGRKLRPGRYIAELQIRDATGNLSRIERLRFRVLKPRRRG